MGLIGRAERRSGILVDDDPRRADMNTRADTRTRVLRRIFAHPSVGGWENFVEKPRAAP